MNIEVKNTIKPVDYTQAIHILESRVEDVLFGKKKELLWILEHAPIYTGGTSYNEKDLLDKKINVIKTKRGGKLTYHGPGQKIVYFVLNLNRRDKDIRRLVTKIEDCIIEILNDFNIDGYRDKKNIGIWVNDKKIAAIGIRVKKWIAYHGFSLNLHNDLSKYKKIIPCGLKNRKVTSLKENGINNFTNIENTIIKKFLKTFL